MEIEDHTEEEKQEDLFLSHDMENYEDFQRTAAALNDEIPPQNILDLFRSPCIPTRIEAFHPLEDLRLLWGSPRLQRFECPLCDPMIFPPSIYVTNFKHYLHKHWSKRRPLGGYVCFPCRIDHRKTGKRRLTKKHRKQENSKFLSIATAEAYHWHCPLCSAILDDFDALSSHGSLLHEGTVVDPKRTLPSQFLYTPFILAENEETEPLKDAEETSRVDDSMYVPTTLSMKQPPFQKENASPSGTLQDEHILLLAASVDAPIDASMDQGIPLLDDSKEDTVRILRSCMVSRKKNLHQRKVLFNSAVTVIPYDLELSQMEKLGCFLDPLTAGITTAEFNSSVCSSTNMSKKEESMSEPLLVVGNSASSNISESQELPPREAASDTVVHSLLNSPAMKALTPQYTEDHIIEPTTLLHPQFSKLNMGMISIYQNPL
ncbi:hypothetical protein IE077_001594 [Cardiosporidium cionae]|uniref:C2H2-type domain-containing protein n=1 Tax=Cardiosporidium cionae TaxID=476202 RepID=A0ABQ7JCM1_9APIC|nr:hypothetical protein IE077_001594 [Cardiosporidium cionae]|eukprot:KAF8821783.1 hypothetical protein IE077_001594 [Cardiosporidium cionae]